MLFLCTYRPVPGTSPDRVDDCLLAHVDTGAALAPHIQSWFRLAEPSSGVLVVDVDDLETLQKALSCFSETLDITVQPAARVAFSQVVHEVRSRRVAEVASVSGS